jgi:protein-L-isoaspartate(D-aspartate) O-methyltransferase
MVAKAKRKEMNMEQARYNMVECQIKPGGVRDEGLCRAIMAVKREDFLEPAMRDIAYADCPLVMHADGASRDLLMPHSFAIMAEAAAVEQTDLVLDIAGGTGYSAAVLSHLAMTVIALEEEQSFAEKGSDILSSAGIDNVATVNGPLTEGQAKQGPFDVIFINGHIETIPDSLTGQLADGGRLVCVAESDGSPRLTVLTRRGPNTLRRTGPVLAAPALAAFKKVPEFEF